MSNLERDYITNNPAIGSSWETVRNELFTPEEIAESNLRVALIGEIKGHQPEKAGRIERRQTACHRPDGDRQDQPPAGHRAQGTVCPGQDAGHRPAGPRRQQNLKKKAAHCGCSLSVSQKRHAPGGTLFCLLRRSENLPPWYPPFGQN